jgi:hypothetical protein
MCLAVFYLTEKGLLRGGDNRQFFLKEKRQETRNKHRAA